MLTKGQPSIIVKPVWARAWDTISTLSANARTVTIPTAQTDPASRMTALERRASFSLASVYAMRMLGLFMVLPVFALEARRYPGGEDAAAMGLALGIYGLVQALLQIPFGLAADRWGRKLLAVSYTHLTLPTNREV